jgi:hypothetical protein
MPNTGTVFHIPFAHGVANIYYASPNGRRGGGRPFYRLHSRIPLLHVVLFHSYPSQNQVTNVGSMGHALSPIMSEAWFFDGAAAPIWIESNLGRLAIEQVLHNDPEEEQRRRASLLAHYREVTSGEEAA